MAETGIAGLQARMAVGELTAVELVQEYLARIEQVDRQGPALHSIIEVNPEAESIAAALDAERAAGRVRGPLHGVPVVLKDNIETGDSMMTTAGSLALEGRQARRDAFVAARLRQAGAVILAKANLSEWANFRSTRSSSGWSSRGGQTRNPYALDRNPCGSSSGSAVAVAANLCAAAVGTETDGSIICPAQANGIVGIKPTVGLVSRRGIIPIAHSQDTAGPMARTVADAALLLGAMTGEDGEDQATAAGRDQAGIDYGRFLDEDGLRGARLGVARSTMGFHEGVDAIMEEALRVMRAAGAEIVDPADIETWGRWRESELEVLLYEFKADLNAYLGGLGPAAPVRSLAEIIAFNEAHREWTMPHFGQELLLQAADKGPLSEPAYQEALAATRRLAGTEGIEATLRRHKVQAIVAPSGGPAWLTDYVNGDHYLGGSSSAAAAAGWPNITVPAGQVRGLPVGISFFSGPFQEPLLIRLAYAFEQATQARRPPEFLPSVEKN